MNVEMMEDGILKQYLLFRRVFGWRGYSMLQECCSTRVLHRTLVQLGSTYFAYAQAEALHIFGFYRCSICVTQMCGSEAPTSNALRA